MSRARASALVVASGLILCACGPAERAGTSIPPEGDATVIIRRAADPAPPPPFTPATEPWTFESRRGVMISTPSFRVFTTSDRPAIRDELPVFMEHAAAWYREGLADLPRAPSAMDLFVLSSRPEWTRFTRRFLGAAADPYLRIDRGGFTARRTSVLFDVGPRDTLALSAHEGWHLYTQSAFRSPLPVWAEEGIATLMEGFRRDPADPRTFRFAPWANLERFDQLRSASNARALLPFPQLLDRTPAELLAGAGPEPDARVWLSGPAPGVRASADQAVLTYYAQCWALIHFLREGEGGRYRPRFERTLRAAAAGQVPAAIARDGRAFFAEYIDPDLARAGAEFERFVAEAVGPKAREAVVQGRSPVGRTSSP